MRIITYILIFFLVGCSAAKERRCTRKAHKLISLQDKNIEKERKKIEKMQRKGCDITEVLRVNENTIVDTFIVDKFIPFKLKGDTIDLTDTLSCDSLGNVISTLQQKLLNRNKTSLEYKIKDNIVYVQGGCESVSDSLKVAEKTIINITKEKNLLQDRNVTLIEQKGNLNKMNNILWLLIGAIILFLLGKGFYNNILKK